MSDNASEEAKRQYIRAKEVISRGKQAMAEGHRLLRQLSGKIVHARTRGQINQQIWECERLSGQRDQFFSQAGQDAYLDERVFKGKRDGVFVEIGGYDGVTGSNCLFFELIRGWTGLLIEPSPTYFAKAASFPIFHPAEQPQTTRGSPPSSQRMTQPAGGFVSSQPCRLWN